MVASISKIVAFANLTHFSLKKCSVFNDGETVFFFCFFLSQFVYRNSINHMMERFLNKLIEQIFSYSVKNFNDIVHVHITPCNSCYL